MPKRPAFSRRSFLKSVAATAAGAAAVAAAPVSGGPAPDGLLTPELIALDLEEVRRESVVDGV